MCKPDSVDSIDEGGLPLPDSVVAAGIAPRIHHMDGHAAGNDARGDR